MTVHMAVYVSRGYVNVMPRYLGKLLVFKCNNG
jgi:hypothetical protein